ncbi:hypothetical protein V3N99_11925 [Dermatophilaceae bacterium Soc4.6]
MTRRQLGQALAGLLALALATLLGSALHTDRTPPQPLRLGPSVGNSLVVVGAGGLAATDLDPTATPALWALLRDGSSASLNVTAVHRSTCPVDGWLTLSAGGRAAQPDDVAGCPPPQVSGTQVDRWSTYAAAAAARPYGTTPGTLAAAAASRGQCLGAVGPGAAVAAADAGGVAEHYRAFDPTTLTAGIVECPTTLVDVGALDAATATGSARAAAVAALDRRVGQVVAAAPQGADLIVAGLADDGSPRLRVVLAAGPRIGAGTLWSSSTRQPGLVQLDDVSATVIAHVGAQAPESVGGTALQRMPASGNAEPLTSARRDALVDADAASRAVSPVVQPLFTTWGTVVLLALLGLGVTRRQALGSAALRGRALLVVRQGLVVAAALPVASFLAMLVPWWRAPAPGLVLALVTLALMGLVGAVALRGPWRRSPTGPSTAVATTTLVVLLADVVAGSRLQVSSLLGLNPVVGGRFYGVGNVTFALVAAALFLVATSVATRLRERSVLAAGAVALLGLGVVVVDAAPQWGADAGGPPALLPGLAVLVLAVLEVRVTWRRALVIGGSTVGVVLVIALLDWVRGPASRSHLGRFVQTLLDGGGGDVITRKLQQNLDTLTGTSIFAYAVPVVLVLTWWALLRPDSPVARPVGPLLRRVPLLRPALLGLTLTVTVGLLVNDTGVAIPPVAWLLAGPLVLAVGLRDVELRERPVSQPDGRVLSRRERWHS